ncbi:MAG TPA: MoxR family ATPase [Clostridia bacterium]|nr:MoxR family ATPase [Clostridia bacterium]HRX41424.1 MoxR family ATPase [Clostridia bacterium]
MKAENIMEFSGRVRENISKVIVGKEDVIDLVLVTLLCAGHVLLEDVPGLGKTVLAKSLSRSMDCDFRRIQFTPDLLPSDLTGLSIFNQKEGDFIFREGPLFTNIVLADEINRATPRTQSALLECMEERQITVEGVTRKLDTPFFVIATQNPLETQGTFPLPEAQMDRFFMRLSLGYPDKEQGIAILNRFESSEPLEELGYAATAKELLEAQEALKEVLVSDDIKTYIIDIVEATRTSSRLSLGLSPRGSLALMKASRAHAAIRGRDFVTPDDVKAVAVSVSAHRIMLKGHALSSGTAGSIQAMEEILASVKVPTEEVERVN